MPTLLKPKMAKRSPRKKRRRLQKRARKSLKAKRRKSQRLRARKGMRSPRPKAKARKMTRRKRNKGGYPSHSSLSHFQLTLIGMFSSLPFHLPNSSTFLLWT